MRNILWIICQYQKLEIKKPTGISNRLLVLNVSFRLLQGVVAVFG